MKLSEVREKLTDTLIRLADKKIDIKDASVMAKLGNTIVESLNTELRYARLKQKQVSIPFLDGYKSNGVLIEHNSEDDE